jgi:STE24 endopeptidase
MSETIATRMLATVLRVSSSSRVRVLAPLALAAAAAEVGARLLAPRERPLEPAHVELEQYFSEQEIRRGARFARPQLAIRLVRTALDLGALTVVVRRTRQRPPGPRGWPRVPRRRKPSRPYLGSALTASGLITGGTILGLPLAAVARRRAIAVGLVTQSWRGWAVDLAKASAIGAAFAGGAGAGTMVLIRRFPRDWWLPAAAGSVAIGTLLGALAPVLLDPLFNDFTPVAPGELRSDVLELAKAAGVSVGEVYAIDASRRTTAANAYVTGLGPTKRVVLFDTLTDRYSRDEVRAVVAHELSHVRHRDVLRSAAYATFVAPAAAFATQRLSWAMSPHRDTPAALPSLALAAALVMAPAGLIGNRLSRAIERRADEFSLVLSGAPDAFISFERAIALQNVADLRPPRLVSAVLATHPPTLERIGAAVSYARRRDQPSG